MTLLRLPVALLLAVPLIGGCNSGPHSNSTATATSANPAQPETVLGRAAQRGIDQARAEMATHNIDISDGVNITIDDHGKHVQLGDHSDQPTLPKAEITPQGDLLIEGKAQAITPAQRDLLLQYRHEIMTVAQIGMSIGVKGADLAGKAMLEVVSGFLHGDVDAAGNRIDADGKKLEAEAKQICTQLPSMLQTQQQLAASLPAFKPYARMTREDVDNCMKSDGAAVTDADRTRIREQIRTNIRQGIRSGIQTATANDNADAASQANAAQSQDSSAKPTSSNQ